MALIQKYVFQLISGGYMTWECPFDLIQPLSLLMSVYSDSAVCHHQLDVFKRYKVSEDKLLL